MKKSSIILAAALALLPAAAFSAGSSIQEDRELAYSRALLYKTEGNYRKAIESFTALLLSGNSVDRVNYQIASCYASEKDFEQAQNYSRKAITENPSFIEPYQLIYDISMTLKNYEAAADILEDLTEANPSLIQYHLMKGSLYYQNLNNYLMAESSLRRVLDLAGEVTVPASYKEQAYLILSEIALQQKDFPESIDELGKAVELNPRNNVRYYRLASLFISGGNLARARDVLERFLPTVSSEQKNSLLIKTMYAYLGYIYYISDDPRALEYMRMGSGRENIDCLTSQQVFAAATGQSEEAAPVLEKIMSEYPKYVTPAIAIGRISLQKGDTEKAYTCFLAAAQLLYKTDMSAAAVLYYQEALRLKPGTADIHLILGQLYETMDLPATAILHYTAYNAAKPDIEIPLHIAYLYDLAGKKARANEYIAKAEAMNPESPRVFFFKGLLASKADRNEEAERFLEKAVSLKTDDQSGYFYLAVTREKLGKQKSAIDAIRKAIELDPENASYLNFLGYLYADLNINLDQAESLVSKALSKEPSNGAYLDSLGWTFYRQGKYEQAIRKLTQARRALAASGTKDPVVYTHLGDAYAGAGDQKKAVAAWKQSLEVKEDPAVRGKIESLK